MSQHIFRAVKDRDYFCAKNEAFQNDELSLAARGLLAYILSKPDHWIVRNEDLYRCSPAGKYAIKSLIRELKDKGYMRRIQKRDPETQRISYVTEVYEVSSLNPDYVAVDQKPDHGAVDQLPVDGSPVDGSPVDGKPDHLVSTDIESTEEVSTDLESTEKESATATPSARKNGKPKRKRDPRLDHPAVKAYREVCSMTLEKELRDDVIDLVGDQPDLEKMERCFKAWIKSGYRRTNKNWLFDWYVNGGVPRRKQYANGSQSSVVDF